MTQKSRDEYEDDMRAIDQDNLHTAEQKSLAFLRVVAEILLDIREKLFNPDMKN